MFMDFKGAFSLVYERKEEKHAFWELFMSLKLIIDITKKVPSLMSSIVFIVFNNSFGVDNHIH